MPSLQDTAIRRVDMYHFDPAKIEVEPGYNVRAFDSASDEDDAALKESIRASGVRTPLTIRVKGNQVVVVAGHRRLAAVKELIAEGKEIKAIPCLPEHKGTSDTDRVLDLIRSNSGKPLTGMQRAEVFKRLLGFGWDEAEIATKASCSRAHVADMLILASAGQDVREMVKEGTVSPTTAVRAMRQEGDEAGAVLASAVAGAKAAGKKRVSAKKALGPAKPVGVEITREVAASDWETLRREADGYIAVLEEIALAKDGKAQQLARVALGWDAFGAVA